MTAISAYDFMRAEKELRETCPSRAFPAIADNCWVDSTMFGLTYAPDIGRVMRAALLGCLENLMEAFVSNTDEFYARVDTWNLEPIWKTYVTRMLLYFLLREKAHNELGCPIVSRWVEDFRKRTFEMAGVPVAQRGGNTFQAISAILTALSVDNDIIIERSDKRNGSVYHYSGKDFKYVPPTALTSAYKPRIAHLSVTGGEDKKVGHIVVAFVCDKHVYLYDNNSGIFAFKQLSTLPTDFQILYDEVKIGGKWFLNTVRYKMTAGGKTEEVKKQYASASDPRITERKTDVRNLEMIYTLHTREIYNRVRKGEDILASMLGAPTVKRLTVGPQTPRIADVKSLSKREMSASRTSSRSSRSSRASAENEEMEDEKGRITKFASCVRDMAATAPYKRSMLFNAPDWEAPDVQQLSYMSSKFRTLLETIQRVDEEDMKKHGKLFKHFIFTDLRGAAYGAKAIGTFLAANGYDMLFKAEKGFRRRKVVDAQKKPVKGPDGKPTYRMVPTKKLKITLATHEPVEGGSKRVGLLQGNPLWKSQVGIDVRKQMLAIFNSRPDNIHGEQIRFMVLDSKFKEGIDLYDVKYVHLMEPAITEADLKQAIGRATRYCGQRGLNFVPNVGWKLNVFLYETQFGNTYPFRQSGKDKVFDAHKYMMSHSGLDLGMLEMTRNLTVLAIKSAVDYDLTYKINNFKMQTEIRNLTDLEDTVVLSVNPQTGGVTSVKPAAGIDRSKCMPRSNKFFPFTVKRIKDAFKARGIKGASTADRKQLCKMLEEHEEVMQDLLTGRRVSAVKVMLPKMAPLIPGSPRTPTPSSVSSPARSAESMIGLPRTPYYELFPVPEVPQRLSKTELEEMPDLADFFAAHELAAEADYMAQHSEFAEFQSFIRRRYAEYGWAAPIIKSACDVAPPAGQPVQFSKSQDFVRHYLTPSSPFSGLLAWHSVGTGKTCTAVATATSEFEKEGYSILWVTRNSLMADVWKNVFGAVCSIPVQEYVRSGKKMPARLGTRKRLLSKSWFDPISYRTLQNALIPVEKGKRKGQVTKLGKILRERNGAADPLRKTFLIIDEVHKLLDGDLKASEMADFDKLAAMIHNSYKVSGKDAVKVLLMTATPITDNPDGLFRLLNVLIPQEARRFPTGEEFRAKYTKADGTITQEGEAFFQSHAKGLISYLNREFDPSAFAQPEFKRVKIVASGADLVSDRAILEECMAEQREEEEEEEIDCDIDRLKEDQALELEALNHEEGLTKKEIAERKRTIKASYKEQIDDCKARIKSRKAAKKSAGKAVALCIASKAKTRKTAWKFSQQKAVKKCFGKAFYGTAPKFTTIGALKKMAKAGLEPVSVASSVPSARATYGPVEATPVRSMSPMAYKYAKRVKKTRKVKNSTASIHSKSSNSSTSSSASSPAKSSRRSPPKSAIPSSIQTLLSRLRTAGGDWSTSQTAKDAYMKLVNWLKDNSRPHNIDNDSFVERALLSSFAFKWTTLKDAGIPLLPPMPYSPIFNSAQDLVTYIDAYVENPMRSATSDESAQMVTYVKRDIGKLDITLPALKKAGMLNE